MKRYRIMAFVLGALVGYMLLSLITAGTLLDNPVLFISGIAFALAWGLGVHTILAITIASLMVLLYIVFMGRMGIRLLKWVTRYSQDK